MMQGQKRTESSNSSDSSSYKKMKDKNQEFQLSPSEKKLIERFPIHFKHELIDLLIYKLNIIKVNRRLFNFLQANEHFLITWALENKNLGLTQYLLENVSESQRFLMLQFQDYKPIKAFITACKQVKLDGDFKTAILPIMVMLLNVKPNWQIVELMENSIKDQPDDFNTEILNQLNSILKSVKQMEFSSSTGSAEESGSAHEKNPFKNQQSPVLSFSGCAMTMAKASDLTQAVAWYQKAADQGDADAETALKKLLQQHPHLQSKSLATNSSAFFSPESSQPPTTHNKNNDTASPLSDFTAIFNPLLNRK